MTITEFLLARIAEDEATARKASADWYAVDGGGLRYGEVGYETTPDLTIDPVRVLTECEAKRRIVMLHREWEDFGDCATCGDVPQVEFPCDTIKAVASAFARHSDFDPTWRA